MKELLKEIRSCTACSSFFDYKPRPIVHASESNRIVIIGQAPGRRVHASGVPWDDASGKNLRSWLGIPDEIFYNERDIALIPMGFCYPGSGKSGDLPPRPECAPLWHDKLLSECKSVQLTLLIGQYAQKYYLGDKVQSNLTETVKSFQNYLPSYFPLPHPSPRNRIWMKKNPWFEEKVLPELKAMVAKFL